MFGKLYIFEFELDEFLIFELIFYSLAKCVIKLLPTSIVFRGT